MNPKQVGFHESNIVVKMPLIPAFRTDTEFTYDFNVAFHPYVGELIAQLNRKSVKGLLDPNYHQTLEKPFFSTYYSALKSRVVTVDSFNKSIDTEIGHPYANYNWELLFHVPLTIAVHLSKNQRFAEAQRWFHFIFDPTCTDDFDPPELRFWKFIAFRNHGGGKQIDELLALLSKPDNELVGDESLVKQDVRNGLAEIKRKPFQPHAVARTRYIAYQFSVIMKYLDNLIAWGDSLFRQDTIESINEATQRYVLAANILGHRPQRIPQLGVVKPQTFNDLRNQELDEMGNTLVTLEGQFPANLDLPQIQDAQAAAIGPLFGIGRALFFCIPRNDKLLNYWDIVADRLFKIRHSLNIEGVARQLALFDPPLDPGMLVKAAAAGIDIGSIVRGLNQPISPVRCTFLIQKALELSSELRSLGSGLLSAIEKRDSESMALLRQSHEIKIQQMTQDVRFLQWKQSQNATEALLRSRAISLERYHHYQRLLGIESDDNLAPKTFSLDRGELTEENFDEAFSSLVGTYEKDIPLLAYPKLKLAGESSPSTQSDATGAGNLYLNANENSELNEHLPSARDARFEASICEVIASILTFIPEFNINLHFWGCGASSKVAGGSKLSDAVKIGAEILRTVATWEQDQAGIASRTASYERRADDWIQQRNSAGLELIHIGRQIIGSLIAEQIAYHEYSNVKKQIENSQEIDQFLHDKFTNEELYAWMQGEISRLYYEYYRFAFDTARKAEQNMKQELMRPEVDSKDYIKFNYWDAGRRGLLTGEALYLDIKQMEMDYHESNKREYEITKHVSLRQIDPVALLSLKATGACQIALPEWLFDLDCPGHYLRRIKNVGLSIPAVAGPYTSVNCTLSLLKSTLRKSPILKDDRYSRLDDNDDRFVDYFGMVQSVVTSTGNNDSGMFETNLREERLLPFEGAGVESTWKLELPSAYPQFDYDTISDVILHIRYTSRQGGEQLRIKATENIDTLVSEANKSGLALLFNINHEFPEQWHQFLSGNANANLSITIKEDHFPYLTRGKEINIDQILVLAIKDQNLTRETLKLDVGTLTTTLKDDGKFELSLASDGVLTKNKQTPVFLLVKYSLG